MRRILLASFLGWTALAWTAGALVMAPPAQADEFGIRDVAADHAIALFPKVTDGGEPLGRRFLTSLRLETTLAPEGTGERDFEIARARLLDAGLAREGGFAQGEAQRQAGATAIDLVQSFDTGGSVQPFLVGGFGATRLPQASAAPISDLALTNELLFDFHLGAGIGYQLTEQVQLTAGYRYVETLGTVAAFGGPESDKARFTSSSHVFGLSIRIPFGIGD